MSGKIAYTGENQHRDHAGKCHHDSLHAEIHAILKFVKIKYKTTNLKNNFDLSKTILYVARLPGGDKRNYFGNCKPCIKCQPFLNRFNVRRIKYTDVINGVPVLCELRRI